MADEDFVDEYIDACLEEDIVKPADICDRAIKDIEDIDKQLEEYNQLRIKKNNLVQVLRTFNHEQGRARGRRVVAPMVNPNAADVDSDPSYKSLLIDICNIVAETETSTTMREFMSKTGYDITDPTPLYQAMKWLLKRGILKRNEDRSVEEGSKWEERPKDEQ